MKIRMTTGLLAPVLALVALLLGVLAAVPSPASADDPAITVTWPTVTAFNPDVYDYVFNIAYDGPGTVTARDITDWSEVSVAPGDNHPVLSDGMHWLQVDLCTDICRTVSQSPRFQSFRTLSVRGGWSRLGPVTRPYRGLGGWHDNPMIFDVAWEVVAPHSDSEEPGPALVAGSASGVSTFPTIGETAALTDGNNYEYIAHVTVTGPEWGTMETTARETFTWDATPPTASIWTGAEIYNGYGDRRLVKGSTFFPANDGYRDKLIARVRSSDGSPTSMKILDAAGQQVSALDMSSAPNFASATWTGKRTSSHALYPEGVYHLVVRLRDAVGNIGTLDREVRLSHKQVVYKTWRRTFPAARTLLRTSVHKCSRVIRPARTNWPGSLGYRSYEPCPRRDQTIAITTHGVHVPYSRFHVYRRMQVTVTGGKAEGESWAYAVLSYLGRDDKWGWAEQVGKRVGPHQGSVVGGNKTIRGDWSDRNPYVVWAVGLQDGSKYDVKSFTVEITYRTLQ